MKVTSKILLLIDFIFVSIIYTLYYLIFKINYFQYYLILVILLIFLSYIFNYYKNFLLQSFSNDLIHIFRNVFVSFLVFISIIYLLNTHFQNSDLIYLSILTTISLLLIRFFLRVILTSNVLSRKIKKRIIVFGSVESSLQFYNTSLLTNYSPYDFIAHFNNGVLNRFDSNEKLDSEENLEEFCLNNHITHFVIFEKDCDSSELKNIFILSDQFAIRCIIIPDFTYFTRNSLIEFYHEYCLIEIESYPLDKFELRILKRSFDLLFSFLILVFVLSWVIPIIYLLIKFNSKGPVFFKQERWGINNKRILCFKFRTMYHNLINENDVYTQASKNDKRVTSVGKYLRKFNVDELPQFLNVINGTMTIVGPRPHPTPLNISSYHSVKDYNKRHYFKPGITGWAQINGLRGETDITSKMQKRVEYDLWYFKNWSFFLDLNIIIQTVFNMIKGDRNAY